MSTSNHSSEAIALLWAYELIRENKCLFKGLTKAKRRLSKCELQIPKNMGVYPHPSTSKRKHRRLWHLWEYAEQTEQKLATDPSQANEDYARRDKVLGIQEWQHDYPHDFSIQLLPISIWNIAVSWDHHLVFHLQQLWCKVCEENHYPIKANSPRDKLTLHLQALFLITNNGEEQPIEVLSVEWIDYCRVNRLPGFITIELLDIHTKQWGEKWFVWFPPREGLIVMSWKGKFSALFLPVVNWQFHWSLCSLRLECIQPLWDLVFLWRLYFAWSRKKSI